MENIEAILKFFRNKDMFISQAGESNKTMFNISVSSYEVSNKGILTITIFSNRIESNVRHYPLKGKQIVDLMKHMKYTNDKCKIILSSKKVK